MKIFESLASILVMRDKWQRERYFKYKVNSTTNWGWKWVGFHHEPYSNLKRLTIPFRELCTSAGLCFSKWVHLPEPCPGISSFYLATVRHLRFPLLSDRDFVRSLKKKSSMETSRGTTCRSLWHPEFPQPLGAKTWAPSLIQPLRKGSESHVPSILPDRCHQPPKACWQEADLKNS